MKNPSPDSRFVTIFEAHGFEPSGHTGGEVFGTCPLTGKADKFYLNPERGVWHSKTAGLGGTVATFLDLIGKQYSDALSSSRLQTLAEDRGLPLSAFKPHELGWDGRAYTLVVRGADGEAQDIRRYRLTTSRRMMSTPGCHVGLWGAQHLGRDASFPIHVVEGEWDQIALTWLLARLDIAGTVVAVPGAGVFKPEWAHWLANRIVHTYYDHDAAGERGELLADRQLRGVASELTFTHWPAAKRDGYDVRDLIRRVAVLRRKPRRCWTLLESYRRSNPRTAAPRNGTSVSGLAPDKAMELMNHRYAVVGVGGTTAVVDLGAADSETYWSFAEFKKFHANRVVRHGARLTSLGTYWLDVRATDRRQYERAVCAPPPLVANDGELNLWSGFAIKGKRGSWTRNREHLETIICGNQKNFDYVYNYLRALYQQPGLRPEVAIAMKGPQGAGKGFFVVQTIAPCFSRRHFIQLSQSRHLTGNFNAHLAGRIVVFADEAFFAGDRQQVGALKALITEPRLTIERKGIDVSSEPNLVHLFVASNEQWVIPADFDERRFLMLAVSGERAQDTTYFGRLRAELDNGGREAMLHELQRGKVDLDLLRHPPVTSALAEQKMLSMQPHERWWLHKLMEGRLTSGDDAWRDEVEKQRLYQSYLQTLIDSGITRRATPSELGSLLQRLLPAGFPGTRRPWASGRRNRTWTFPPLSVCRAHFESLTRARYAWPKEDK